MSYRDTLEAAQARVEFLEGEVERLRAAVDPAQDVAAMRAAWESMAVQIGALRAEVLRLAAGENATTATAGPSAPPTLYERNRSRGPDSWRYPAGPDPICPECAKLGQAIVMTTLGQGTSSGAHCGCPQCGFLGLLR
jgi:hypothetical protein